MVYPCLFYPFLYLSGGGNGGGTLLHLPFWEGSHFSDRNIKKSSNIY